ncbi:MAG: helicase [Deltaproteobacteria bacterium]|nr:MAG: helicase [Deltaproteobacteria bacterium]
MQSAFPPVSNEEISSSLMQTYLELGAFEQGLLQFLSVVYEPPNLGMMVNCLRKMDYVFPRGNRPTSDGLEHYLNKLQKAGLLNQEKQCREEIVEILSKKSVNNGTFDIFAQVIMEEAPLSYYHGKWTTRCWRAVRDLRIGVYTQDFELIFINREFLSRQGQKLMLKLPPTVQILTCPFDADWLRSLPGSFQFHLLEQVLAYSQAELVSFNKITEFMLDERSFAHFSVDERLPFRRIIVHHLLLQGKIDTAKSVIASAPKMFKGTGADGAALFLGGETEKAVAAFDEDEEFQQQMNRGEAAAFSGPIGLFHILCLIKQGDTGSYPLIAMRINKALSRFMGNREIRAYNFLLALISALISGEPGEAITLADEDKTDSLSLLFAALCEYWISSTISPDLIEQIKVLQPKAMAGEFHLFSLVFAHLLEKTGHEKEKNAQLAKSIAEQTGLVSPVPILETEEPWKRSLEALIHATSGIAQADSPDRTARIAWFFKDDGRKITITPREQKGGPNGWSKGRQISLARLYYADKLKFLTAQDRKICSTIQKLHHPTTGSVSYRFALDRTLPAMVGHPCLFSPGPPSAPIEFTAGEPKLLVEEKGDNLHICFSPKITGEEVCLYQETPTRFMVIQIDDNHRRIARITGPDGLTVPKEASGQVLAAIGGISSFMTVHSAIAVDSAASHGQIKFIEADSTIYIHLLPYGSGFRLEMFVKPFPDGGHYLKPGQGVENIMAEVKGQRLQTRRDLALEEKKAREVEELCPILDLAMDLEQENDREWHLQDPDDCLQALLELQKIREQVVIEWPEGEKLAISQQAGLNRLNLRIRTNRQNWFAISGGLAMEQDKIIPLRELLARVKKSSSRFIELADGHFIALTRELRNRLEEMNAFADGFENDDELLIHPLAAMPLKKITGEANISADQGWQDRLERLDKLADYQPEIPSTLQAELRDYQKEGFYWLARLSRWGAGGCLADDMGLGKTIQSLSVILMYAADGPSLVVAPTSVSTNWQTEVGRFSPTLKLKSLIGGNRKSVIENLGSFDLLITTYTLLQQEQELLSQVSWQTVILDEAQAIKNAATKRSHAAMSLQANFKMITTGTPIENHLGELWNLFNFINPGLLGSLRQFNEKFAVPIERFQNRSAKKKLKKLIRPFILRRIKSDVLEELPPKTEITLEVQMNRDERYFYEALRQNALAVLENEGGKKGRHLQILTEIMRLRQACCNPRLIDPDTSIQSAKLETFAAITGELLKGRHKALVFSQFIEHLQILREYLDAQGISYQYLDGGTSPRQRKTRVDAFQAGEGDLFLISLKAGGLGLNLTAADYVLHMDPWWNPAIEDQASDRAHRLGQKRPVTIYRLVCKDSIEEKIVKLHQEKRDLAGNLLEGSDMSARMSSEDLLALLGDS